MTLFKGRWGGGDGFSHPRGHVTFLAYMCEAQEADCITLHLQQPWSWPPGVSEEQEEEEKSNFLAVGLPRGSQ